MSDTTFSEDSEIDPFTVSTSGTNVIYLIGTSNVSAWTQAAVSVPRPRARSLLISSRFGRDRSPCHERSDHQRRGLEIRSSRSDPPPARMRALGLAAGDTTMQGWTVVSGTSDGTLIWAGNRAYGLTAYPGPPTSWT